MATIQSIVRFPVKGIGPKARPRAAVDSEGADARHADCGIYTEAMEGGDIAAGGAIEI
jgi:uncharacterized protein YcbX